MDTHALYTTNRGDRKGLKTTSPSWYNERTYEITCRLQTSIRPQKECREKEEQYEAACQHFLLGTFLAVPHVQCAGSAWQGRIPRGETAQQSGDTTPQASRN